jgi:hypothetical protein
MGRALLRNCGGTLPGPVSLSAKSNHHQVVSLPVIRDGLVPGTGEGARAIVCPCIRNRDAAIITNALGRAIAIERDGGLEWQLLGN